MQPIAAAAAPANGKSNSRRKGKAFKIERKAAASSSANSADGDQSSTTDSLETGSNGGCGSGNPLSGSHVCAHCELAFMDQIMYSIHMGYHGYQNPFKCNMCGEELTDKVSFFLHVARKSHQ